MYHIREIDALEANLCYSAAYELGSDTVDDQTTGKASCILEGVACSWEYRDFKIEKSTDAITYQFKFVVQNLNDEDQRLILCQTFDNTGERRFAGEPLRQNNLTGGLIEMKTIGLLGGMSWESTALYYRLINQGIKDQLGGLRSARIAMVSVDFQEIEEMQRNDDWTGAGQALAQAARQVEAAGADFLLICTNTMHKVAPQIQEAIRIPILHIADATAKQIKAAGITTVGLLGTSFTMEQDFYRGRLVEKHGLKVVIPPKPDREIVHRIIFDELCLGLVKEESRNAYLRIMEDLRNQGAEGIIEGCTEIVMLVQQQHTDIPLFDTTFIHAKEAVLKAIG